MRRTACPRCSLAITVRWAAAFRIDRTRLAVEASELGLVLERLIEPRKSQCTHLAFVPSLSGKGLSNAQVNGLASHIVILHASHIHTQRISMLSMEDVPPPGTALVEELDKRLLVQLRDGRKLVGILRSFDQFANLVLEKATERIIVGSLYAEVPLGLYVVRGENVVLLGEIDESKDPPHLLRQVSESEIKQAQKGEAEADKIKSTMKARMNFLNDFD